MRTDTSAARSPRRVTRALRCDRLEIRIRTDARPRRSVRSRRPTKAIRAPLTPRRRAPRPTVARNVTRRLTPAATDAGVTDRRIRGRRASRRDHGPEERDAALAGPHVEDRPRARIGAQRGLVGHEQPPAAEGEARRGVVGDGEEGVAGGRGREARELAAGGRDQGDRVPDRQRHVDVPRARDREAVDGVARPAAPEAAQAPGAAVALDGEVEQQPGAPHPAPPG